MPSILVVGATGQQGGGVINALLSHGRDDLVVRALTRNPASRAAKSLEARGVQPVKGDLLDRQSLMAALTGVDSAYLVTDFRGPEDIEGELKQGRLFIDTAKESGERIQSMSPLFLNMLTRHRGTGVRHLVFSSVAGADISQPVDHFYTKFKLEEHLRASGLEWTVVRPVGFMEVIPPPGIGRALFLSAMASLMGTTKQKYVACDDIGKAVAEALLRPAAFSSKIVTIAGQVADVDDLQEGLEKGEGSRGWGRIWMPRWLVIRMTPHHYRQMFDVSVSFAPRAE